MHGPSSIAGGAPPVRPLGAPENLERYELLGELATGGMATVYLGRQRGALGFSRTVAIKSMHPQLAKDPAFRAMFIDEAHLTARIRHPNVVPTLDIVQSDAKLLIIMEYVEGVALSVLLRAARERGVRLPPGVVAAIGHDVLEGLHAAHELTDDMGEPFGVVHRDVSPQNILVGVDGVARVVDFGVAKATGRSYKTQTGEIRGKVGYMAPEQMFGEALDRRVDIYASGVVLWEALAGERLFNAPTDAALVLLVTKGMTIAPSVARGERLPEGLDQLVERALSQEPAARFATTAEMSRHLTDLVKPASRDEVGRLVRDLAASEISSRAHFFRSSTPSSPTLTVPMMDAESRAVLEVLTRATMAREVSTVDASPAQRLPVRLSVLALMAVLSTGFLLYALVAGRIGSRRPPVDSLTAREPLPLAVAPGAPAPAAAPASSSSPPVGPGAGPTPAGAGGETGAASALHTSTSTSASASPAPAPPPAPRAAKVGGHKPAAAKPTAKDCTPPYTTDAAGSRHYKPECI